MWNSSLLICICAFSLGGICRIPSCILICMFLSLTSPLKLPLFYNQLICNNFVYVFSVWEMFVVFRAVDLCVFSFCMGLWFFFWCTLLLICKHIYSLNGVVVSWAVDLFLLEIGCWPRHSSGCSRMLMFMWPRHYTIHPTQMDDFF